MSKKLVLAEKPSVGRDIAKALKCDKNGNGYIEGKDYIVTWALGHLVTLADPETYKKEYSEWKIEQLPIIPSKLHTIVIKKTGKQFNTVKHQINRDDVSEVIIATDAGREGELVARWILEKAGNKKPVKRLWISSVTEKAIVDGFKKLRDGREYENLYRAAVARSEADWYVGINGTRALTCKYNAQLSCGRVQTPTLAMVQRKEEEIQSFKSQKFYGLETEVSGLKFIWSDSNGNTRSFDQAKIESVFKSLNGKKAVVEDVSSQTKKTQAPKLYDLTELQKEANRIYGYSGKETLSAVQNLYEKHKALTYPRTDSSYISSDMVDTLSDRVKACSIGGYSKFGARIIRGGIKANSSFVDDSKVSDHHAIVPTEERPVMSELNDRERKVYEMVIKRFLGVLMPPHIYEETKVELRIGGELFRGKGKLTVSEGYRELYSEDEENVEKKKAEFKQGMEISTVSLKKTSGETSSPPRFTEGTLLGAMENPRKYMDTDDKELLKTIGETGGIGTVATRADIVDKLFNSYLLEKRGNEVHITSKGRQLLELAPEDLKSPVLTAEWEQKLEKISKGKLRKDEFIKEMIDYTKAIVSEIKSSEDSFKHDNLTRSKCPSCGKYMLEVNGKKGKMLVCQDRDCGEKQSISRVTNARCPECKKKMEMRGSGDSKMFICKCGYREKLSAFNKRKGDQKSKLSKKEVRNYLNKQEDENINSALADALAKLNLK